MNEKEFTHIHLTYFKQGGKYYSEGDINLEGEVIFHEAVEEVIQRQKRGQWEGLTEGSHDFHTLVEVYTKYGPLSWLIINEHALQASKRSESSS